MSDKDFSDEDFKYILKLCIKYYQNKREMNDMQFVPKKIH